MDIGYVTSLSIGGHPELARAFLLWLQACESETGQLLKPTLSILGTKRNRVGEPQNGWGRVRYINLGDCMRYLTKDAITTEILKDPLIAANKAKSCYSSH